MNKGEKYIKVLELDNEAEARLIESVLQERDIPHSITNYFDVAFDGIFQMQRGWGIIEAPPAYKKEIRGIYADLVKDE